MIVDACPVLAAVVGAVEAALLGLDQGVDAARVGGRDRDADLAPDAFGQAVAFELLPGVAAVARDVEAAAGAAARQLPGPAARLPEAGEQRCSGSGGSKATSEAPVSASFLRTCCQRLAAVPGAVDAAFRVGAEGVAEHRGEGDVGILRVDDHGPDLAFLLPDVRPGLAGVGRLVDAVARGHVAADVGLARADVDDVRVGRRHGDRADRRDRLVVEDRLPGEAAVARLPDAARGRGGVVGRADRRARRPRARRARPRPGRSSGT